MNFNDFCKYIDDIIKLSEEYIDIDELFKIIEPLNIDQNIKNELLMKIHSYDYQMIKKQMNELSELKTIDDNTDLTFEDINLKIPESKQMNTNKNAYKCDKIDIKNYIKMIDDFKDIDDFTYLTEIINKEKFLDTINYLLAYYTL